MLQLELLLSDYQLLVALLQLRNVPPNVQQLLQQIFIRTSDVRQTRLVQQVHVLTLAAQHLLQLHAARFEIFNLQVDFVLLALDLLSDAQSAE